MTRLSTAALLICLSVIWVNAINKVATYVVTQQQERIEMINSIK